MDLNDVTPAPSTRTFALSAGLLAATACFCGVAALAGGGDIALVFSPLFLGALAGACAARRPIRAAIVTVLVAVGLIFTALGPNPFYFLAALPYLLAWSIPTAILGAICGANIRRRLKGGTA
jgi:hypothetical protein